MVCPFKIKSLCFHPFICLILCLHNFLSLSFSLCSAPLFLCVLLFHFYTSISLLHSQSLFCQSRLLLSVSGSNYAGCRYRQLLIISNVCVCVAVTSDLFENKDKPSVSSSISEKTNCFFIYSQHYALLSYPLPILSLHLAKNIWTPEHSLILADVAPIRPQSITEVQHWCWCSNLSQRCWMGPRSGQPSHSTPNWG